jgi:hypothetical protein
VTRHFRQPKHIYILSILFLGIRLFFNLFQFLLKRKSSADDFFFRGFLHFERDSFFDFFQNEHFYREARNNLDEIERSYSQQAGTSFIPSEKKNYTCEFINHHPFYSKKLGPRLRVTYPSNEFENWPGIAQKIIYSDAFMLLLTEKFGTTEGVYKCYLEKTFLGGDQTEWHVDSLSQMGRLIVLLSDVDMQSGPMEYIEESHHDISIEHLKIKLRHLLYAESWTADEKMKNKNLKKNYFCGKNGESYFFDSRGLHRARLTERAQRYVLVISFTSASPMNRFFDSARGGWPAGTRKL